MTDETTASATTADDAETRRARFARGWEVLEAVNGASGQKMIDSLADVAPEVGHQVVAWAYGDVYARPGMTPRDRQIMTIGMLTALGGCEPQLEAHIATALNVGVEADEIVEGLLHSVLYCGFPKALNAIAVAKRVFAERGLLPTGQTGADSA